MTTDIRRIPVNEPLISAASKKNVNEALDTGWISSAGPFLTKFEEAFAAYIGAKHAIACSNGTTALHLALAGLDIGPGDEVIVPAFTMIAPVFAIMYTGATPVFVDADPETFNIDAAKIAEKISKNTKAIMPVHIYGHSCDMDPILALGEAHGIPVIEDAAEAHGATYNGRKCGSMGKAACFSFYGNKIITCGEGGMVVTSDDAVAARARALRDLCHSPEKRFVHTELGYNYRMTNIQAAIGLGELGSINDYLTRKRRMAEWYGAGLAGVPGLRLPVTKSYAENVFWMYGVIVEPAFPMSRDELRAKLKNAGIDTRDFFYNAATQPAVRESFDVQGAFPVTDALAERGFYLPSGLALTNEQVDYVCTTLRQIAGVR